MSILSILKDISIIIASITVIYGINSWRLDHDHAVCSLIPGTPGRLGKSAE
jgi:hypothetical protein